MALAFGLWLALSWLIRRLRLPTPVLVTATLSWIVAWLFILEIPSLARRAVPRRVTHAMPPGLAQCPRDPAEGGPEYAAVHDVARKQRQRHLPYRGARVLGERQSPDEGRD